MICPECGGEFVDGVAVCPDCERPLVVARADPDPVPVDLRPMPLEPGGDWIVLLRTGQLLEADLAATSLEEAGIPHFRQEQDSSGLSLAMPLSPAQGPGTWWVIQVPVAAAEEARSILERLPITLEESPGVWDFGPTEGAKSFLKSWAFFYLVLFALAVVTTLVSLFRGQ